MIRTRRQGDTPFFPNMLNNGAVMVCLKEDVDAEIAARKKQFRELTQKCDRESLKAGMEEYYLNQKIADFEALCKQNGVDFAIVNERDAHRREPHKEEN